MYSRVSQARLPCGVTQRPYLGCCFRCTDKLAKASKQRQSFLSGLPNGHPPKKQKKSKKDDELPSYESMMDGSGGSGMNNASEQPPSGSSLGSGSAGAQEAALYLLQSLLQVTPSCSFLMFALMHHQ